MPKVYIIIVTWNSAQHLSELLLSLRRMDYPNEDWNLVAVDNNSRDNTVAMLNAWQIKMRNFPRLVQNKTNLGFSGGNNQGIKIALDNGADYIVLLNDDIIVQPNWLRLIINRMEADQTLGLCQPLLTRYPETRRINNFGNAYQYCGFGYGLGEGERSEIFFSKKNSAMSNFQSPIAVEDKLPIFNDSANDLSCEPAYCSFSAVAIRAEVFKTIGFMDELYFMYHEDTDFCFRARLAGWKLLALRQSVVHHNYKFPAKKNKIRYFWLEKNRLYLMLKFFKCRTLFLIAPAFGAMEFGLLLFSIRRGFFWQRIKAYWWIFRHWRAIMKSRKKVQTERQAGDKKLFDFFAPTVEFQEIKNPLLDKIGHPILRWYWGIIKTKIK